MKSCFQTILNISLLFQLHFSDLLLFLFSWARSSKYVPILFLFCCGCSKKKTNDSAKSTFQITILGDEKQYMQHCIPSWASKICIWEKANYFLQIQALVIFILLQKIALPVYDFPFWKRNRRAAFFYLQIV